MPIHDWSRVGAGTFHDFHVAWTIELRNALNERILPPDYYAMAEAVGNALPDMPLVLAPDTYVNVPLEETYQAAWRGVPRRWQRVLEA